MTDTQAQIDKLANFIMAEVPNEPSQSEGAVDTAIRIIATLTTALTEAEAKLAMAREALSPSGSTKAAYMGEFYWIEDFEYEGECAGRKVYVPWTTIKEIMAAIRLRACLAELGEG